MDADLTTTIILNNVGAQVSSHSAHAPLVMRAWAYLVLLPYAARNVPKRSVSQVIGRKGIRYRQHAFHGFIKLVSIIDTTACPFAWLVYEQMVFCRTLLLVRLFSGG